MIVVNFKRFLFIGLLFLITINAHLSANKLFHYLRISGLDLPLTPFTADMTLMLDKNSKAYYTRDYLVRYQTGTEILDIKIEDLGWYEFKAPFQWLSECQQQNEQCLQIIYFLCKSLNDYTGKQVQKWKIVEISNPIPSEMNGIGVSFLCHN